MKKIQIRISHIDGTYRDVTLGATDEDGDELKTSISPTNLNDILVIWRNDKTVAEFRDWLYWVEMSLEEK